jgi:DNA polymerase elongation subunit (family B)
MTKTGYCLFDIETAPLDRVMLDLLAPEFKPAANLKDTHKIKASIEDKRQAYYEQAALSPVTGKVLTIGYEIEGTFTYNLPDDEQATLENFWHIVRTNPDWRFIGFNIAHFDLPFLIRRSMKHGLSVPMVFHNSRYLTTQFIDLMEIWQCGDRSETISLDRLSRYLGVGEKKGSGADFARLWVEDRQAAIEYLRQDIALTRACAEKMKVLPPRQAAPATNPEPEPEYADVIP